MSVDFDEILYPSTLDFTDPSWLWWVAHTKPNQERKLAADLKLADVTHFLPLIEKKGRSNRPSRAYTIRPLFPGYLFFAGEREERKKVLETGRTANILGIDDHQKLAAELEQVYRALLSGLSINPCANIREGQLFRLISGPGMGLQGKVVTLTKKSRVVIEIESIGQSMMVEVDAEDLELVVPG
ncbi:MAG: transcription termination/antitermination NusG family protein [bacterium]|jgi:transcription antitermination factor NusG|nr:transcription termination/antitermination NusG family protein [bacterium]